MNGMYLNGGGNTLNFLKDFSYEATSLTVMPLVFEKTYHASIVSNFYKTLDIFKDTSGKFDNYLYDHFLHLIKISPPSAEMPDPEGLYNNYKNVIEGMNQITKDLKHVKHPNKAQIIMLQKAKSFKKGIIDFLEKTYHTRYFFFNTHTLDWMWKEEILKPFAAEVDSTNTANELMFVSYLSVVFENEDDFLFTDDLVEETLQCHFAPDCFNAGYSPDETPHWFISLPLYNLRPALTVMPEKELRQARNAFIQQARKYYEPVKELGKELREISFLPQNLQQICSMVNSRLNIDTDVINDEISSNPTVKFYDNLNIQVKPVVKLHMGITSPRNLIHHYTRLAIIQPFEATAVIKNIEKFRNPDGIEIFFYTTIISENDGTVSRGVGLPLNGKVLEAINAPQPGTPA